jgi:hypothetical protein
MAGAVQRLTHGRVLVWEQAALLRMEQLIPLEQYTGQKPAPQPAGMLDMHLRASARGIKAISLKQYLASKAAS